jgi:hypothetical protein
MALMSGVAGAQDMQVALSQIQKAQPPSDQEYVVHIFLDKCDPDAKDPAGCQRQLIEKTLEELSKSYRLFDSAPLGANVKAFNK